MSRPRKVLNVILAGLLIGAVLYYFLPTSINRANYARIEVDMPRAEVERILGRKADQITPDREFCWIAKNGDQIKLQFLVGRVCSKDFVEGESVIDKMRGLLGLQQKIRE